LLVRRPEEENFVELAQAIVMWMQRLGSVVSRREVLSKLSTAFALAAAARLFDVFSLNDHERVAQVLQDPSTFDELTLRYCENMVSSLRRQGDTLCPQLTLHSAMGYRDLAQRLAKTAPLQFQQRALSVYAELAQLVGWLCFNMGGYRSVQHYYDDARSAAHDAHNVELATYALCTMSHLATGQGKARVGLRAVGVSLSGDRSGRAGDRRAGLPKAESGGHSPEEHDITLHGQPSCRDLSDPDDRFFCGSRSRMPAAPRMTRRGGCGMRWKTAPGPGVCIPRRNARMCTPRTW
jgi:hypothetical protein